MSKTQRLFQVFIALALVAGLLAPAVFAVEATPPRMSASLAELVAGDPDGIVRVIVQKAGTSQRAESLVQRLGGQMLKDLPMINAFAAELPAKQINIVGKSNAVNWVSLDAPVISTGKPVNDPCDGDCPPNTYLDTLGVPQVWEMGFRGDGIGVAVIDSGIFTDRDFSTDPGKPFSRIVKAVSFSSENNSDLYGHGTHVAGIIGGNGNASDGLYTGIAPKVDLINLKISDDLGMAYESDTVAAMQWIFDNKDQYNIRVVNLSIQSTVEQSYHDSALSAAAQILWFNGVVIVAATGNWYGGEVYPLNVAPGNDPFVITVGATDEKGTTRLQDDYIPNFSAWGLTQDGFMKPEIFAPGVDIISVLSSGSDWYYDYPDRAVFGKEYFRISGTSMATPMVTGAVALLLQAEPNLTPDQVKYRVMNTHEWVGPSPYLNIYKMLTTPTTESANQDVIPHMLLAKMAMIAYWASENGDENIDWENVDWDAVNWDAVDWDAVNWNAVNWNAVNWNAVNWNAVNWNAVNWNAVNWNAVNWNAVNWNAVNWNAVNWNAVNWNAVYWGEE
jgi:serine protease AprX